MSPKRLKARSRSLSVTSGDKPPTKILLPSFAAMFIIVCSVYRKKKRRIQVNEQKVSNNSAKPRNSRFILPLSSSCWRNCEFGENIIWIVLFPSPLKILMARRNPKNGGWGGTPRERYTTSAYSINNKSPGSGPSFFNMPKNTSLFR